MKAINPVATETYATFARASSATYWKWDGTLQTVGSNVVRLNWDRETADFNGALIEPARTNLVLNSTSPGYQTCSLSSGQIYTLSFYGSGSIVLTGAVGATVVGYSLTRRTTYTFTAGSSSVTLSPSGSVQYAQLELGGVPTSVIVTAGSPVTRAADVITGTGVFYSTFTDTHTLWVVGDTYALDAIVKHSYRLYKSLQAGNVGRTPATEPTWWLDIGPDNIFAAFDRQSSTASVGLFPGEIVCIKYPSSVNALAALNVDTSNLSFSISTGYSDFSRLLRSDSPRNAVMVATTTGTIATVSLQKPSGVPSVGEIVCGLITELGSTQYGFQVSLVDYSKKTTDDFGVTTFVPRGFAKRATAQVMVTKANYNAVIDFIFEVRANPTVFIASDDADYASGAIVYGFPESFDIEISYPQHNLCNLQVQGLT